MTSDYDRPQTPAWRQGVRPPARKREAQPDWRKEPLTPEQAPGRWSKKVKLGASTLAFLACSALLIWVIYWLWPGKPTYLVLVGAGYEDNLAVPHNVYGERSLNDLAQLPKPAASRWFSWGRRVLKLMHDPKEFSAENPDWASGLGSVKDKETVVIFLALHGGADHQGAYLLPNDTDYQQKNFLYVHQILDEIKTRLPQSAGKVLILDATQIPAHWSLGMLHNDFARRLRDLEESIKAIDNLVVLSASDVDQRSWVSDQYHQTIFAHFVIEGLKGAADQNRDNRVDAFELYQYVRKHVKTWVRNNRNAWQTPVLLGGKDRAKSIELVAVTEPYPSTPPEKTAPGKAPDKDQEQAWDQKLEKAWQTCRDLAKREPAPAVYTPQLWRRYQDTLLRYEQLLRAGAAQAKISPLETDLDTLEKRIVQTRRLALSSVTNTLAMPAALGLNDPSRQKVQDQFNDLWNASPEEYPKKWQAMQQGISDPTDQWLLQLRTADLLLRRAGENRQSLAKARELLRCIGLNGNQRPAEAHFMAMLGSPFLKEPFPRPDLLGFALSLRRFAENVALAIDIEHPDKHPYSEIVFPWIKGKVETADERRGWGQDRLFATDSVSLELAEKDLDQAQVDYKAAKKDADVVREALRTRDEVLAALPYYCRWLARRRTADEGELRAVEDLWEQAHELAQLLETPHPAGIAALANKTAALAKAFKAQKRHFDDYCKQLTNVALQSEWRDLDDVLLVPTIDPARRMALIRRAQEIAGEFHKETAAGSNSDADEPDQKKLQEAAQSQAQREGRMSLALLGQRWFNDESLFKGRASETFSQVANRIHKFMTEEHWWESLDRAGAEIGLRWRRLPGRIEDLMRQGRTATLDQAAQVLQQADRLARQMDGAAVLAASDNLPGQEYRGLLWHNLLLWQAERTFHDHWFAQDPANNPPYYVDAASLYVKDAKSLAKSDSSAGELQQQMRWKAVLDMEEKLKLPGELAFKGPPLVDVTSEPHIVLPYQLEAAAKGWTPAGHPVVWFEPGKFLHPDSSSSERTVVDIAFSPSSPLLQFGFTPEQDGTVRVPKRDETFARASGFYRGQIITERTPIYIHRLPDVVYYKQPTPVQAGIAVRAAEEIYDQYSPQNGAIAIILDCTGSMMWDEYPENRDRVDLEKGNVDAEVADIRRQGTYKYKQATDALKKVLQKLPPKTTVSVWVFGQLSRDAEGKPKLDQPPAEKTITPIRLLKPWDAKELGPLMNQLEALVPWGETPIVRSLWEAKRQSFPKNLRGFKTILVLTDGMDNRFRKDKELRAQHPRADSIGDFLKEEFADSGIRVNVIGFKVAAGEGKRLAEQFKKAIEHLPLPGKFYTVDKAKELAAKLETALQQKLLFILEGAGGRAVPNMPEEGWGVSRGSEGDRPFSPLQPGRYTIRVPINQPKPLEQAIQLAAGDYLQVTLTGGDVHFERVLYGKQYDWRGREEKSGWLLAVLQNQLKPDSSLELLATLEKSSARGSRPITLQQARPRMVWFDVKPSGVQTPIALRWGYQPGYPAPAWSLSVAQWPPRPGASEPALPEVTAWWSWEKDPPRQTLRRAAGADLGNFTGETVQLGGDPSSKVVIENPTIERHTVELRPGVKQNESCLVVRARYPQGKPIFISVQGLEHDGEEHWFYSQAHRYTAIFWPADKTVAANNLQALDVIDLDKFKNDPRATSHLTFTSKNGPDSKPRPPMVLRPNASTK